MTHSNFRNLLTNYLRSIILLIDMEETAVRKPRHEMARVREITKK